MPNSLYFRSNKTSSFFNVDIIYSNMEEITDPNIIYIIKISQSRVLTIMHVYKLSSLDTVTSKLNPIAT